MRPIARLAAWGVGGATAMFLFAATASADPPPVPTITEPATDAQLVHPADVHMEVAQPASPEEDACTDWEIWSADLAQALWRAPCAQGVLAHHIHLGDGSFLRDARGLEYDSSYVLRARFRDDLDEVGGWALRRFDTVPPSSPGGGIPWTPLEPGYVIDEVAGGFQLPLNVAFVPAPGPGPKDPLLYVAELYGTIKVVTRDGTVSDYATGLLNFDPLGSFPGSGEHGLTGLAVDPASGDVLASMLYASPSDPAAHYPKVVRLHSADGGVSAASRATILDMAGETQGPSHQVSNLSFGPDGKLYVHVGDGFVPQTAQDLSSFRGKILRVNVDGTAPADNPLYDASDGITARDYVLAYGLRNPFGGAWRAANGAHYEVENGPAVDRLVRVDPGVNYGYDGSDASMLIGALYNWAPSHAPVNMAFVQPATFGGSGFPAPQMDRAFVTESGPTWATGPQERGKRIVEFDPDPQTGEIGGHPHDLVEYTGTGKATAVGLAAGPDGLYFTELYNDRDLASPVTPGGRLLRVRYGPPTAPTLVAASPASGANENSPRIVGTAQFASTVGIYTDPGCVSLAASGTSDELETTGIPVHVPDNSTTRFYAADSVAASTSDCSAALTYVEQSPAGAVATGFNLRAAKRRCAKKFKGKARARCVKRAKKKARAVGV
ncbi:MAG TPA: PQQ-dependent sugar dehydrogenase [Solirubrobacterales bacterium]|nr:PQQ-dependent sugar dehydrogenase [Solirubrobacterales bacterium]